MTHKGMWLCSDAFSLLFSLGHPQPVVRWTKLAGSGGRNPWQAFPLAWSFSEVYEYRAVRLEIVGVWPQIQFKVLALKSWSFLWAKMKLAFVGRKKGGRHLLRPSVCDIRRFLGSYCTLLWLSVSSRMWWPCHSSCVPPSFCCPPSCLSSLPSSPSVLHVALCSQSECPSRLRTSASFPVLSLP